MILVGSRSQLIRTRWLFASLTANHSDVCVHDLIDEMALMRLIRVHYHSRLSSYSSRRAFLDKRHAQWARPGFAKIDRHDCAICA